MHWRAYVCTREKVLPASLLDRESAKKFALCAQNGLKLGFYACWASFVAEEPREGPCRASFFAEEPPEGRCWASFSCRPVLCPGLVGDAAHFVLAAMGVLHYKKPSGGVSPACRTPV